MMIDKIPKQLGDLMIDVLQPEEYPWIMAKLMVNVNRIKGKKALSILKYLNNKGINIDNYFIRRNGLIIFLKDIKFNRIITEYRLTGDFYEKV